MVEKSRSDNCRHTKKGQVLDSQGALKSTAMPFAVGKQTGGGIGLNLSNGFRSEQRRFSLNAGNCRFGIAHY